MNQDSLYFFFSKIMTQRQIRRKLHKFEYFVIFNVLLVSVDVSSISKRAIAMPKRGQLQSA